MNDNDLDVCECGDYRKDHKGGTGVCIFSDGTVGDGHHGAGRCDQFRLSETCERSPRWLRDEKTNELFERQGDGSYRAAYRLTPLAN